MFRAGVPEAAVHEDRNFGPCKGDVRACSPACDVYAVVAPVPVPGGVEGLAERNFRARIAPPNGLHIPATAGGRVCFVHN